MILVWDRVGGLFDGPLAESLDTDWRYCELSLPYGITSKHPTVAVPN